MVHIRPLQPLQPQHLLSNKKRLSKRMKILFLQLQWCLHNAPIKPRDNKLLEHIQPCQQLICDSLPQTNQLNLSSKARNSPRFRLIKCFPLFPGHSKQWIQFLREGGGLIQVDIGGHPSIQLAPLVSFWFNTYLFVIVGSALCLKRYTSSRCILVASHLIQLSYLVFFHVITSCCTSRVILGP